MLRVSGALDENGIPVSVSIDKKLYTDLVRAKDRTKGNWDNVFIISGLPGMGKSFFGITTMSPILAEKMSSIWIEFDIEKFINRCVSDETKEGDVVILDEGHDGMNSGRVAQADFQRMMNLLMLIRQKKLFILIITQNFFDLAKSIAIFRSNILYNITTNKDGKRGVYVAWDRTGKKNLYILGKKFLNYFAVRGNVKGQFNKNVHLLPKDYEERKHKHLLEQNKSLSQGNTKRIDVANRIMSHTILNLTKLNFKQNIIAKIMGIGLTTLREHWAKMKRKGLVPEKYLILSKNPNKLPILPSKTPTGNYIDGNTPPISYNIHPKNKMEKKIKEGENK